MTRKALGRGLNALLSEMTVSSNEEFKEIEIDLIEPNNLQPRTKFDENKLNELAQSIKENGVVQPILVRRINSGRYQIVAGERRWRAAQRAGLQQISAIIRDIADDKMLELALVENIQRQELNAIEEAYAYKRLIDTLGLTQETVAQRVGRDRTFVTNYLRLLRLPEDIQELVEENKISMGHARALLGVDDPNTQREVAKNIIGMGLSVRDTERAIKRLVNSSDPTQITRKSAGAGDIYTRQAEAKLRRKLSTQVKITSNINKEGGKIEIHYYNDADLQRIYELLSSAGMVNEESVKT
ncbi:MAG: ParB/RepB/Spo0J family partition protein [Acidobacteria bacterium]|nr:ParB/RepB/Spo0J family partition protein [Acidobacteriota bacterium]